MLLQILQTSDQKFTVLKTPPYIKRPAIWYILRERHHDYIFFPPLGHFAYNSYNNKCDDCAFILALPQQQQQLEHSARHTNALCGCRSSYSSDLIMRIMPF